MDESTANNNKRILAILVSYYNPQMKRVVIEHLTSCELIKVNTDSIYKTLTSIFTTHNLPWNNLVSILMDSCRVMRGAKNGLEVRVRREQVELLDIDGDSCHHIHNITKNFCKHFDHELEKLYTDIHNDHKWSADLRSWLQEVCELLEIKFTAQMALSV